MEKADTHTKRSRVLVSGAGTGIGRGIALGFARSGADVVFHYSHSSNGAVQAAAEARDMGCRAEAMQADFTDVNQVIRLGEEAAEFLGGLDVLVNNSGITMNMPFAEVTPKQFDTLYSVNVKAMFFLSQKAAEVMMAQHAGCIINISSVHAYRGLREHSVYASTKGAINSFTQQLAIELAPYGIRVNAIASGPVEVENHKKFIPGYTTQGSAKRIPAGFKGEPEDIGSIAQFLASEGGRYIIGQTILADGGFIGYMPIGEDFVSKFNWSFGEGYVER